MVCSVAAARPAVSIRWYLGDSDVTASAETEETPTDTGVRNFLRHACKVSSQGPSHLHTLFMKYRGREVAFYLNSIAYFSFPCERKFKDLQYSA